MTTLSSPVILAVTRRPIGNVAPIPPAPAGSHYPTLDQVMDWFDGWVKTFDPALLGVDPEKPIYIYYLRLKIVSTPVVEAFTPDIMDPPSSPGQNPTPHRLALNTACRTVNSFPIDILGIPNDVLFEEFSVFLPDMAVLETSKNYVRNALLMGISVQVRTAGGDLSASSLPFPVWLPGPLVREPTWGDIISFGDKDNSGQLSWEYISNYLGLAAYPDASDPNKDPDHLGGQIRWYSLDDFELSDFEDIRFDLMDFLHSEKSSGANQLVIVLPEVIRPMMQKIRRAGRWIYSTLYWDDDCAQFYLPDKPNAPERPGFVIIWRDDIPSRVIPFVDVEEFILEKLKQLANQLWKANVNGQIALLPVPIPVGGLIEMGVERLADAATSLLATILGDKTLTVQFEFKVVDESSGFCRQDLREVSNVKVIGAGFQKGFEPNQPGVSSQKAAFRYKPVVSTKPVLPEQAGAFSLQLRVLFTFHGPVKLLKREFTIKDFELDLGLPVIFQPEPLVIPTLAIFFYHYKFQGPALVTLPKGTGLFGKDQYGNDIEFHFDSDTPGKFNEERKALISKLESIHTLLTAIQVFWDNETVDLLTTVLGIFSSVGMSAVDTSGAIPDLRSCMIAHRQWPFDDITFGGSISSVVLIGVPYAYSKAVVKVYQNIGYNDPQAGKILDLVIPDDCFIAAILNFQELHKGYHLDLVDGPEGDIPLPYGDPAKGQPAGPEPAFKDLNDHVGSIRFQSL